MFPSYRVSVLFPLFSSLNILRNMDSALFFINIYHFSHTLALPSLLCHIFFHFPPFGFLLLPYIFFRFHPFLRLSRIWASLCFLLPRGQFIGKGGRESEFRTSFGMLVGMEGVARQCNVNVTGRDRRLFHRTT